MSTYTGRFSSFADAVNGVRFELLVPEYYEPNLPSYYTKPRMPDPPVVNGELLTWDEYYQLHPEEERPKSFVPLPIFKSEDYNISTTFSTIPQIMEMVVSNVEFRFCRQQDIRWVVELMDGYREEVAFFIGRNPVLDKFLAKMATTRAVLWELVSMSDYVRKQKIPLEQRGPVSLDEILSHLLVGGI